MSDHIALRGIRVRGFHGVFEAERRDGQDFVVDVDLTVDTRQAGVSDELSDTVDYAALASKLAAVVSGEPVNLIETLAKRLADVCMTEKLVEGAEVTVHKPQAPVGVPLDDVSVTIVRRRRR
ncbi:MAG TPA: dihydroneopterin aldolase [Mycobacteriales bacterium]|nr:dihydroneopterin aldolase [Mycobacteriales bacterium]